MAALFGAAEENEDFTLIKAYVTGEVTGDITLCIVVQSTIHITSLVNINGAIKGHASLFGYTLVDKTFYEVSASVGPRVIYKL